MAKLVIKVNCPNCGAERNIPINPTKTHTKREKCSCGARFRCYCDKKKSGKVDIYWNHHQEASI